MLGSLTTQRIVLGVALALIASLLSIFVFWKPASGAATVPSGFQPSYYYQNQNLKTDLKAPIAMAFAPDGRLFVADRKGKIRIIDKNGTLLRRSFVTIPGTHLDTRRQRGIQGIALHPDFPTDPTDPTNRFVYVHYTQEDPSGGPSNNRIVRFTEVAASAGATTPTNRALEAGDSGGDPGPNGKLPFELDDLGESRLQLIHNGGHIHFGNDGKLYIGVGDNKITKIDPPPHDLQALNNFFGKFLRINDNGTIPQDNPYVNDSTVNGKYKAIWARGFRNPFSFGVQPPPGNLIYINDVGEQTWEEINDLKAGANYGWPVCEGTELLGGSQDCPSQYTDPILTYQHSGGDCAVTGGTFYPSSASTSFFPAVYQGDYFFSDFCNGWIKHYDLGTKEVGAFATGVLQPIDLQVGPDGGLYYLEQGSGSIGVIRYTGASEP
jgi:glucose/arabinose dehydrogenase